MRLIQHLLGDVENFYKTGIYKISFSDKPEYAYVGSAFSTYGKSKSQWGIYKRLNHHLCHLKKDKHSNLFLQRVFNKYGSSIQFEILEILESSVDRENIESSWMEKYRNTHTLLNLTPETKLSGRLNPLPADVRKRMSESTSKSLKGKTPLNFDTLHDLTKRIIEEYLPSGELVNTYLSLKDFSDQNNLCKKYCSYYLRKQNTIPKIKDKTFKYLNSKAQAERPGLQFKVIDLDKNETVINSLNDLCISLKTTSKTLNARNVKNQTVLFKGFTICPINSYLATI